MQNSRLFVRDFNNLDDIDRYLSHGHKLSFEDDGYAFEEHDIYYDEEVEEIDEAISSCYKK